MDPESAVVVMAGLLTPVVMWLLRSLGLAITDRPAQWLVCALGLVVAFVLSALTGAPLGDAEGFLRTGGGVLAVAFIFYRQIIKPLQPPSP